MTRPSEASVVPIRLTLDGRTGVTLWATPWEEDGEEWQAFLGVGRKVLVFYDMDDLAAYLSSGQENDLTDHPSWTMLTTLPADQLEPEEGYEFDLDGAYDLAAGDPDPFSVSALSDLVDMVQRIAECCDDGTLLRVIEDTPEFAGLLADEVTYAGSEGEEQWIQVGQALDRSWELVVDRLGGLLEWRGEPPPGMEDDEDEDEDDEADEDEEALDDEDEALDEDADEDEEAVTATPAKAGALTAAGIPDLPTATVAEAENDADEDDETAPAAGVPAGMTAAVTGMQAAQRDEDEDDETVWTEAGIIPIVVGLPAGTGYTLRTYVEDEPRLLGADLKVYLFRSPAGLVEFCQGEDEHDLTELETWPLVQEADPDELVVDPADEETYDLSAPGEQAVELARDLADYCQLAPVEAALSGRAVEAGVPFDTWVAAVAEIANCVRWYD